jgi:Matrixin
MVASRASVAQSTKTRWPNVDDCNDRRPYWAVSPLSSQSINGKVAPMFNRSRGAMLGLATMLSVAGAVVLPSEAKAYTLEGLRWQNEPTSGCCASLGVQYGTLTQTYDSNGYYLGFLSWNHSFNSGVNVNVTTVSSSPWTADDLYNSGVQWDGISIVSAQLNGQYFNAVNMHLNYFYTQNYSQQTVSALAAHEIGHGLGLADSNACVIMQPSTPSRISCNVYVPQQDDKNGVNAQY